MPEIEISFSQRMCDIIYTKYIIYTDHNEHGFNTVIIRFEHIDTALSENIQELFMHNEGKITILEDIKENVALITKKHEEMFTVNWYDIQPEHKKNVISNQRYKCYFGIQMCCANENNVDRVKEKYTVFILIIL